MEHSPATVPHMIADLLSYEEICTFLWELVIL